MSFNMFLKESITYGSGTANVKLKTFHPALPPVPLLPSLAAVATRCSICYEKRNCRSSHCTSRILNCRSWALRTLQLPWLLASPSLSLLEPCFAFKTKCISFSPPSLFASPYLPSRLPSLPSLPASFHPYRYFPPAACKGPRADHDSPTSNSSSQTISNDMHRRSSVSKQPSLFGMAPDQPPNANVLHHCAGAGLPMLAEVEHCDCVATKA